MELSKSVPATATKDPKGIFTKSNVDSVSHLKHDSKYSAITYVSYIRFKSDATSAEHKISGESILDCLSKSQEFINQLPE